VGRNVNDVGIERIYRPHDRREVGRRRRIVSVGYDLEATDFLDCLTCTVGGVLGEFGISSDNRDGLWAGLGLSREFEEPASKGLLRLRPCRQHREVLIVMELSVGGVRKDANGGLLELH